MDTSSVNTIDYINIVGNYTSILNGDEDDESVLRARGYTQEQINRATKTKIFTPISTQGLKFTAPLIRFKYPLLGYTLTLLKNYEKGNLPFPGAISEQPAQVMDILSLLQLVNLDFQNRIQKKNESNVRLDKNQHRTRGRGGAKGPK